LAFTTVAALIELGINAYFISLTTPDYFIFSVLGIATALLTLLTIPVMLIVDFMRRGAFTSMIVVELVWLSIMWVLWVATGGEAAYTFNYYFPAGCIYADVDPVANTYCNELQAVEAFAFLNFIIFLIYTCVLLAFSINASNNGRNVWNSSVKESTFLAPSNRPVALTQYSGAPATGYNGNQSQQYGSHDGVKSPQMSHSNYAQSPSPQHATPV
ncbi:hypothetical protein M405DRAFT_723975, partial [Rhizopogon salebrosus TDB-379]